MADVNANIGVNIDTSAALAQLKDLQRQISQFHSSIAKSSEAASLAQRDLQRNFLNSVNSIGAFSAELRTVKTTSESFTASLEKNKFSMREYFRYAGASTKTFGRLFKSEFDTIGKVAEDRVKTLQTQYIKMGRDASGAMKAIAIRPDQLDLTSYSTQAQIAAQKQALFNQLMKQGSTNLLNFGKNTQWAGRQLMVGFSLPLMAVGSAASKTFMQMEAQALRFKKVYGDLFTTQTESKQALADIQALGKEFTKYGIAVSDTVGLAADAAAAGFKGLDLQRQTTEATRLSVLGQIDNQQALQTTISLQNAFGISSADLAQNIDFLNAVENQTVTSLDDITTAIPKVAPVIQQLGGNVKDLAFFLTAMKEGGINASEGANALKSGLASLINPTKSARDMLKGMGIDIAAIVKNNQGDLKATVIGFAQALDTLNPLARARAIEQMFGKFQFARLSTLFQNVTKDGTQASRVLELAGASVEDLAALSNKELGITAGSAMNKFKKAVEDLKVAIIPVGEAFLKTVTPILNVVTKIAEKFSNLSDGTKKAITVMVTVIGGLGPVLLMTFGLLANGVANIIKLFLTLRTGYQKLTGQSQNLGEQTQYMTMEQLDAAAAAHSLNQAHATLTQQFTAEATAIQKLITAYQSAAAAGAAFAMRNPGMMMPPRKMAGGGLVVGPGSGTSDSVPVMLSNGESVIPADKTKKYGPLISGMIAGNLPGFAGGVESFSPGGTPQFRAIGSNFAMQETIRRNQEFANAQWIAKVSGGANSQRQRDALAKYLAEEIKKITDRVGPELVGEFKTFMETTAATMEKVTKTTLDAALKEERTILTQYSPQSYQQEKQQFAHIGSGIGSTARDLQSSGAITNQQTLDKLAQLVSVLPNKQVGIKSGFGFGIRGDLNNDLGHTGAELQAVINEFRTTGIDKWKKMIEIGGGDFDKMTSQLTSYDQEMSRLMEARLTGGATTIVDTQAQVEQARAKALAAGQNFDESLYVVVEDINAQAISNLEMLGTELGDVIQTALATITEVRVNLTAQEDALLGNNFLGTENGQARLSGRLTPGGTNTMRKRGGAGIVNSQLQATAVQTTDELIQTVQTTAGVASPSKRTIPIGEDIARGLEVGIKAETPNVIAAAENMTDSAINGAQSRRKGRASRPAGAPPTIPMSELQQGMVAAKISADSEARMAKFNKALQGGSFALMSLSGVAQMFGGSLGKVSSIVFNLSGVLFALMTVTQALTQTQALKLASDRAALIAGRMQEGATGLGSLLTKGGGLAGFGKNLLTVGRFAMRFAGGIGLAITAVTLAVGAFNLWKKKNEEARLAIEGLGDAALLSTDKVKTLGDFFGIKPQTTRLERTGTQLVLDQKTRSQVDELRGSEGFQKNFKNDIQALKGATSGQASLILKSLGIQLKGKGFAKEQIDTIIKALQEESGKTDLKIDFSQIDLSTKGGQDSLAKSAETLGKAFGGQFGKGYTAETKTAVSGATGQIVTWTDEKLTKGLKKSLSLTSKAFAGMINGLSGQLENGSITAQQFNQSFETISTTIEKMPKPQAMLLMDNIIKNMPGPLAKAALGIKNVSDQMLIAKAAALGISTITPAMIKALQTASTSTDARAGLAAGRVRAKIKEDMKAIQDVMALVTGNAKTPGTGGGTGGEKSKLQLAIEQLKQQQTELKNTANAYALLKKAGLDSATAMEYAKDQTIALGLATKGLKLDQVKALAELMKSIEKSSSSQAVTEFFLNMGKENKMKENLYGIAGTLSDMGASLDDINGILGNPEIASYLSDPLLTAEQSAERIQRYLDGLKTGKSLDFKIKIATPEGVMSVFSDLASQASTYFDILEKSIQDKFAAPIKAAEEAATKAADAVKAIQTEIEGLNNQSSVIQRQMDITINRPLDLLQQRSAVLTENMALIDHAAESVNAKYDAQAAALTKISDINQEIANQQKQQLDLASAITSGDIAAAARAEQEMRSSQAAQSASAAGGILEVARQKELAGLTANGMTADQIKAEQYKIERQTYALEQQRIPLTQAIQVIEDKIYEIQNGKLLTAQKAQDEAEASLTAKKNEMQIELDAIDVQRTRWEKAQLAIDNAKIAAGEFDDVINATNDKVAKLADMWNSINTSKNINMGYGAVNSMVTATVADTQAVKDLQAEADAAAAQTENQKTLVPGTGMYLGSMFIPPQYKSMGGVIKKYMAAGGYARGTDTVPAMLTPGEFVVKKFAVDKFGVDNLKSINNGTFNPKSTVASVNNNSNSVYNYGISVNVSNSNASTDDIARAVMTQIRNVDNQRIRGQR